MFAVTDASQAVDILEDLLRESRSRMMPDARVSLCLALHVLGVTSSHVPARQHSDTGPLRVGGAVTRPEKLRAYPPYLTPETRQVPGVVILEVVIDEEGCVLDPRILKGLRPDLDQAAVTAVRQWVYEPAHLSGKPVTVYSTLHVNFQ
jgi:TonB family protein